MKVEQVDAPILSPSVIKQSLAQQGAQLPIGTVDPTSNKLQKDMAHRRWNLRMEKRLGKMRDDNRRESPARFTAMVVGALYEKLGALAFAEDDDVKRGGRSPHLQAVGSIGQLWYGDVLYAYIWLRRQCVGPSLNLDVACPRCGQKHEIAADLDTLEVRSIAKLEDAFWEYVLKDPIIVRGKPVERILFGPPRWVALEATAKGGTYDSGDTKAKLIVNAIVKVIGHEDIAITEQELDELSKYDLEAITDLIDTNHIGPDLAIEVECTRCKNEFRKALDWNYDGFFRVSGRSAVSKP